MQKITKALKLDVHPQIFWGASLIIWTVIISSLADAKWSERFWSQLYNFTSGYFGWLYILSVALFLGVCGYIALSPFSKIRLGKQNEKPEYSFFTWLSMLFSAGMGIGLVFNCISEPVTHFQSPPIPQGTADLAAAEAMKITYLHWGFHAWAIYAVVGACIGYFHFRKGYPISLRHTLTPLLGKERVNGPIGWAVDILAIVGTLFGVAASLGYGSAQINSGLAHLLDFTKSDLTQILIIAAITGVALFSVLSGLNKGIKYLSQLNMVFALLLLVFILFSGPTLKIFYALIHNFGDYLQHLPQLTFNPAGKSNHKWLSDWTLTYWGWWIAWAPFVGVFIARISKGRTLREFMFGVILAPSLLTFLWMTTFGEQAIELAKIASNGLAEQILADKTMALFAFLEFFPFSTFVSIIAVCLISTFFITSSDSGSLVIDMLASGGKENPPVKQKVYWALLEGIVAAALILGGGLAAVQSAALNAAVPFCIIMVFMCWALIKSLKQEKL